MYRNRWVESEITNHRGKNHSLADIKFNKIGFDQKIKYVVISMW